MPDRKNLAVVIGAGPAGLMAAGALARAGHAVQVAEAKPSVARKFLMAGKSGLNLTRDEPFDRFLAAYGPASDWLEPMIRAFDSRAVQAWARDLGCDLFTGSTGRVFPKAMKASPLLRAWMGDLGGRGVRFDTRWRWTGWKGAELAFDTPGGPRHLAPGATVLALGGASWARLGSDGTWSALLRERGIALTPFAPSNAALAMHWSSHMTPHFGAALKSIRWSAGNISTRGEAILSRRGLEGGGIYSLTPALRDGSPLYADLLPDLSHDQLEHRLAAKKKGLKLAQWLRSGLRLPPAKVALVLEMVQGRPPERSAWVGTLKALRIAHAGLRPMDEAISTAGGIPRADLTDGLMLRRLPGVFCAGEMLDWDAPTGGYLLTGCFATGRWAGQAAARFLDRG